MNTFKGNINLANMMLDTSKTSDLQLSDNPLSDLINILKDMEPKLFELIASMMSDGKEHEHMLKVCILVVDDLHITI